MEPEDLVTVCTVNSPTEAELIRSALQSIGIACQIGGESQAGLAGILQIDVLIHASDEEKAREHLRELRHEKRERKRNRIAARHAKAPPQTDVSEAIQEMPPRPEPEA